ncbi:MAG: sulfotransferase [Pseudomonadales bacterium]
MPASLEVLRRLAEQQSYPALREACDGAGPDTPGTAVLLALADAGLGQPARARRTLAAIDAASLDGAARVDLAAVHIALGELDAAVAALEAVRRESERPGSAPIDHALLLARLAWCRLQQGQRARALEHYEQSLRLRPRMAVFHNLMRLYLDEGRLGDLAACLDAAWTFWSKEQGNWPDDLKRNHAQRLRNTQLDLLLAGDDVEAAEAWLDRQEDQLGETDWCDLLARLAHALAARDRHAQAEEWLRDGVRRHPEHLPLYGQLAALAQLQGRVPQAIALLRTAIRLATAQGRSTTLLWARLSSTALMFDPGLARAAAERARSALDEAAGPNGSNDDDTNDERIQVELAVAAVEVQEQQVGAAERRYRQVLEQHPQLIPALKGLGQLLMQVGRLDEAAAAFEQLAAIDPAEGHGALIFARHFPDDDDVLDGLEKLARRPGLEGSVRTGLLFQLAAAWEKREAYDRAFALAGEANAACRRLLRYDPKAHRQHCARIRHAFSSALYAQRAGCGLDTSLPVFVVGMPRSGTTLVEQLLAGHSRIHGAGELGVIPRVIAGLERWERRVGSGRRYPDCADDLDPKVLNGIAERIVSELREYAPDADHVVDKLPHNFENIGLIKLLFPRAKIISVRRDPRDIAISNYFTDFAARQGGMGFAYDLDWIGEQLADHNLLMHHWQQVFPSEILEIHYDDLVDHPEASARAMLDYVGVAWESKVLDFAELERPIRTASVWQVRQPLYSSSKARWQHYQAHLSPLIRATNRKIEWTPIEMLSLPQPGLLNAGVDRYRDGDLDEAERCFKQLLLHVSSHAAASFMLGLVYVHKGHRREGIELMERGVERCPWNHHWRTDLARAYRLDGRDHEAAALADHAQRPAGAAMPAADAPTTHVDYLFHSGDHRCAISRGDVTAASC